MGDNVLSGGTLDLTRILESAQRLGVEMDEADALQWLTAMAAGNVGGDVVVDTAATAGGAFSPWHT